MIPPNALLEQRWWWDNSPISPAAQAAQKPSCTELSETQQKGELGEPGELGVKLPGGLIPSKNLTLSFVSFSPEGPVGSAHAAVTVHLLF